MKNNILAVALIALVIGAGGGYYAGKSASPAAPSGTTAMRGSGFARGGNGNGVLAGTVAKQDASSVTLDLRDGSSRVVLITPATAVLKSVAGSMSDLSTGANIIVTGKTNSDGSVSASQIQLRPALPANPTAQ